MEINYAKIQNIIDNYELTTHGTRKTYRNYSDAHKHLDCTVDDIKRQQKEFIELLELIPIFYKKSWRKGKSSYTLKHQIENYMKHYHVSNTMAIIAFAYLDYTVKFYRGVTPNINVLASFEIDTSTLEKYIRKLKAELS
jgi:hypothetical protein